MQVFLENLTSDTNYFITNPNWGSAMEELDGMLILFP